MFSNKQSLGNKSKSVDYLIKFFVCLTYLLFVANNLRKHELWRDELQAWLIAKVSSNPLEVIINVRYEGRPPLWHELLWILTRISNSPESMKSLNFILIFFTVILIAAIRNLSPYVFTGLIFGFYFAYGFSTVSRDYTLIAFFIALIAYLESTDRTYASKPIATLLAFTNLFGLMFSLGYLTMMIYRERLLIIKTRKIIEYSAHLTLISIATFLTLPPSDSNFDSKFELSQLKNIVSTISLPFLPFHVMPVWIKISVALTFFILWICLSTQSRVFISPIVMVLLLNSVFGYDFYWWHKGTFLLIVLFAIYLTHKERNERGLGLALKSLTVAIIFAQLLGTVFGIGTDFRNSIPYSNAKNASSFVQELCSKSCTLVSDNSVYSASISAYLDAKPIYSLPEEDFVTYKKWRSVNGEVSWATLLEAVNSNPNSIAIVSTLDLSERPKELVLLRQFSPSIWGDNYAILTLRKVS